MFGGHKGIMRICIFVLQMITLFVVACSNPKDANENNFSKAIQDYLDHREANGAYCMYKGPYPYDALTLFSDLPALENLGLVKKLGIGTSGLSEVYDLTNKGREFFKVGKGFCYGKPVLVRVNNFSEPSPSEMYGQTVSTVTYEYKLIDVPEWAFDLSKKNYKSDEARMMAHELNSSISPVKEQDVLFLTNKGWLHETLFRQ